VRRWLLATVVVAALVVGTAAAIILITHRPSPSVAAVKAEPVAAPRILRRSARPDRPPCRLDNVDSVSYIKQSAPWGPSTGFAVRPNNDGRCTLSGTPLLSGVNIATGKSEPIPTAQLGPLDNRVVRQFPATIDPGEPARVDIHGALQCPAGQKRRSYRDLALTVGTKKISLPTAVFLSEICGADVSHWYVEPPMLYAALNATLKVPTVLRRGEDFTYTVKIDNVYSGSYPMPSCPVVRLGIGGTEIEPWQRIACTQSAIHGHNNIAFTLYGRIPPDTEPGRHKLTWMAAMSTGEALIADMGTDGATVTVTR
jgi:hypothetical protein